MSSSKSFCPFWFHLTLGNSNKEIPTGAPSSTLTQGGAACPGGWGQPPGAATECGAHGAGGNGEEAPVHALGGADVPTEPALARRGEGWVLQALASGLEGRHRGNEHQTMGHLERLVGKNLTTESGLRGKSAAGRAWGPAGHRQQTVRPGLEAAPSPWVSAVEVKLSPGLGLANTAKEHGHRRHSLNSMAL